MPGGFAKPPKSATALSIYLEIFRMRKFTDSGPSITDNTKNCTLPLGSFLYAVMVRVSIIAQQELRLTKTWIKWNLSGTATAPTVWARSLRCALEGWPGSRHSLLLVKPQPP
jgi:hypothetical protein